MSEHQKYIDDMETLFASEGWQWILTECKQLEQSYGDVDHIETLEALKFAKGVRFACAAIRCLPELVEDLSNESD